jgi:hypothetical protein
VATAQGGFVFRWQALALGCSEQEIASRLRRGDWVRLRRGAYASHDHVDRLDAQSLHVLLLRAVAANLDGRVVAAGSSALAALGVPLWGIDLRQVHVHREPGRSSRREAGVTHHRGALTGADVVEVDGLLVAAPERAVLEAARSVPFEQGVVLADGARRLPGFDLAKSEALLEEQRDWPASVAAARALRFSDPRAATVGESRARVLLARIGCPMPELQHPVVDERSRRLLGIADFHVKQFRTVIEFDGKLKYGRALYERPGKLEDVDVGEVVWAEKRREDAFRDQGLEVVRLVWSELDGQDATVRARLLRAFARGAARHSSA